MSSSRRKIRLFSDVGAKMSMFNKRAQEHHDNQMINPFSEWGGSGTRRKLSREDPDYGRPVEGSKTAERGRLAQIQMIGDMVELCDMIYDCGIRSPDGRAAISFGDAFRLYSSINDKVVGLLMRGRKHKILDFEGEMLFQGRDEHRMIELLLPLNTIRHKYGMPERAGCGEVDHELLKLLAEQDRRQKQQRKQQRTRSVGVLPPPPPLSPAPARHQKSRSVDNSWPTSGESRDRTGAAMGPEKTAGAPVKSGETGESGEGAEGAGGQGDAAKRANSSAVGGSIGQQSEGTAAAVTVEAEGQSGGAGDRLYQQTAFSADDSGEGHDAACSERNSEGGQDTMSILSQLMRDETLCADVSAEEHGTHSNTDEQCRPRPLSPGSGRTHSPPKLCLPEIRIGECHEPSATPTSADSWPRMSETQCALSVGHGQGQGHPSAADLRGCPGLTATDRAEVVTGSQMGPEQPEPEPRPTSELGTASEREPDPGS